MPAGKRTSSRAAESEPAPKRVEVESNNEADEGHNSASNSEDGNEDEDPENEFEPYEYVTLPKMSCGGDAAANELDEDDEDDEEESEEEDESSNDLFKKAASEHPDHKYIISWEGFKKFHDYCRLASYCDPDAFGMYIYNDFMNYGIIQLIENALHDFDKDLKANNTKQSWAVVAALAHFLNHHVSDPHTWADDGERVAALGEVVGCAVLSALNAADKAGLLKNDSELKDLGLVMALYVRYGANLPEVDTSFTKTVCEYAKKADIDLLSVGVNGIADRVGSHGSIEALEGEAKADRWGWTKKYNAYTKRHRAEPKGKFTFNILQFTRAKRAQYAFDKVDPLAQFSDKDLKEGNIIAA